MRPGTSGKVVLCAGVIFVAAAALACRAMYLAADPPPGLSVSRAPYTDEGLKYYQARNRALFGRWFIETPYAVQGHLDSSPVPTVLGAAVFRLFGVGRVQARAVSVVCGSLSVLVMMLVGVRHGLPGRGLLAGALMAVNFLLFSYDRLALFEAPTILLCLCAAFAFLEGGRVRLLGVPLLLITAYFTRVTALAPAAALAAAWALEKGRRLSISPRKQVLAFVLGIALVLAALAALSVFFPENQITGQLKERFASEKYTRFPALLVAADLLLRTLADSVAAVWMPVLLAAGLLGAVRAAGGGLDEGRVGPGLLFLLWFLAAFAMVGPLDYRPTRYYLLMLPAVSFLAADWLAATAGREERRVRCRRAWAAVGVFAATGVAAVGLRFAVANRHDLVMFFDLDAPALRSFELFVERWFIGSRKAVDVESLEAAGRAAAFMWRRVVIMPLAGGALFAAGAAGVRVWRRLAPAILRSRAGLAVSTAVLITILGAQAWRIRDYWRNNLRYGMLGCELRVREAVGERPDACIGGNWATSVCMGTPYFTFPLARGNGNAWDTFKRFPVTHLILEKSRDELVYMWEHYPEHMERCTVIDEVEIDDYTLLLLEYRPEPDAARPPWPFEKRGQR